MSSHRGGWRAGAGRPAGSKNRYTEHREELAAIFARKDYDPVSCLIEEARNPATPQDIRVDIHKELLGYLHPRKRPVEARMLEDNSLKIIVNYGCDSDAQVVPTIAKGGSGVAAIDITPRDVAPYDRE